MYNVVRRIRDGVGCRDEVLEISRENHGAMDRKYKVRKPNTRSDLIHKN